MRYLILLNPNRNIPFFEQMKTMCVSEAKIVFEGTKINAENIDTIQIGNGHYMTFDVQEQLSSDQLRIISKLSFFYTIFKDEGSGLLRPLDTVNETYIGEDLSIRLKYTGKTNETFTRMLINLGVYSSEFYNNDCLNLLDPVCGKGTTLYEGLINGYNVYGVEKNKKDADEISTYLSRYLKDARFKHSSKKGRAVVGKDKIGETIEFQLARDKEDLKNDLIKTVKIFRADTIYTEALIKDNSIHVIVGDLPYGIQHMGKNESKSFRNLEDLLRQAFSSWYKVLKKGGTIVLSWNIYTNTREDIKKLLEEAGFTVLEDETYDSLEHRVSQAITRDIIVGKK